MTSGRFDRADFYLGDPYPTYQRLRAEDPVHWYDAGGFWVLTKYDDIKFVSTHPKLFSSRDIAILSGLVDRREGRTPDPSERAGVMFMDPPEHGPYRKAVSHRFTPKAVSGLEDHVRGVIGQVLDSLPDGEFDLIEHVAEPIPVFVFSRLLGVPEDDWKTVVGWATTIANAGSGQATQADRDLIMYEIGPYLWELIAARHQEPADDLLSLLTTTQVAGRPLDEAEMVGWAITLLAAGSETTQSLIAATVDTLVRHPDQSRRVFEAPELAANTVEETLRWWTPVISMAREATADVELRGVTIRKGDGVLLLYASGNRDEERWGGDADVFRIDRFEASGHLGFGIGEHFCMGAHLARREGRIFLEELAARARGIEVVGERVPRVSPLIRTYDRLPVRLVH
jgi:cytochrome P450